MHLYHLRQGGYVLVSVSQNYIDFHKIRWKGGTWDTEETIALC